MFHLNHYDAWQKRPCCEEAGHWLVCYWHCTHCPSWLELYLGLWLTTLVGSHPSAAGSFVLLCSHWVFFPLIFDTPSRIYTTLMVIGSCSGRSLWSHRALLWWNTSFSHMLVQYSSVSALGACSPYPATEGTRGSIENILFIHLAPTTLVGQHTLVVGVAIP